MRQTGPGARNGTSSRRHSGARRLALTLPVLALAAGASLVAHGALRPVAAPKHSAKSLISLIHAGVIPAARAGGPVDAATPLVPVALRRVAAMEPVASATAPGSSGDGTLHVAASLLDSIPDPSPIAPAVTSESPGIAAALPSRLLLRAPEQVAALTPLPDAAPMAAARAAPAAWQIYAAPFNPADRRPRVALVVAGVDDAMDVAIAALPPAVTLALDPYARRLSDAIALARFRGHEVMLTLSAPAIGRGQHNAGPMAILSSADTGENLDRLHWALDRASGFVGVLDTVGDRPAAEANPILNTLGEHGLMLVSGTAVAVSDPPLPVATAATILSPNLSKREVEQRLALLLEKARHDGQAVGIAVADPALLHRLVTWVAGLEKESIALVPATATIAAPRTGIAQR